MVNFLRGITARPPSSAARKAATASRAPPRRRRARPGRSRADRRRARRTPRRRRATSRPASTPAAERGAPGLDADACSAPKTAATPSPLERSAKSRSTSGRRRPRPARDRRRGRARDGAGAAHLGGPERRGSRLAAGPPGGRRCSSRFCSRSRATRSGTSSSRARRRPGRLAQQGLASPPSAAPRRPRPPVSMRRVPWPIEVSATIDHRPDVAAPARRGCRRRARGTSPRSRPRGPARRTSRRRGPSPPRRWASATGISRTSRRGCRERRALSRRSTAWTSSAVSPRGKLKSKVAWSGPTKEPRWTTVSPRVSRRARWSRWVALWCRAIAPRRSGVDLGGQPSARGAGLPARDPDPVGPAPDRPVGELDAVEDGGAAPLPARACRCRRPGRRPRRRRGRRRGRPRPPPPPPGPRGSSPAPMRGRRRPCRASRSRGIRCRRVRTPAAGRRTPPVGARSSPPRRPGWRGCARAGPRGPRRSRRGPPRPRVPLPSRRLTPPGAQRYRRGGRRPRPEIAAAPARRSASSRSLPASTVRAKTSSSARMVASASPRCWAQLGIGGPRMAATTSPTAPARPPSSSTRRAWRAARRITRRST